MDESSHPTNVLVGEALRRECGRRLRQARLAKQWRLQDLVDALPKGSISGVAQYEQGHRAISIEVARRLATVLDVSAAWLVCMDDSLGLRPAERELVAHYRAAAPVARELAQLALGCRPPR